ncbi:MAG TPA: GNAT family N-acetyltransferase, partial [Sphingomonas sp.]|nr:GNAT family N-acetyltransferase [Sphingomonas sp.]
DSATADAFESALRGAGWRVFRAPVSKRRLVDIDGRDFAAYWGERPGRLRSTIARKLRSHPLGISIYSVLYADAWRAYEEVYRASWKPEEGSFPFLRALAEQESAAGALRLGIGRDSSGRPVAAQLWLVENGVATIHKLAHREDAREGSPGSLLSHAMFRAAIDEDRVKRIDFGLGDEPYKADWMERAEPVWRIDAYRPFTPAGLTGVAREIASRLVQRGKGG